MKYITIGQASYDITFIIKDELKENEKIKTNTKISCGGGCAANCAYLLSKWKEETFFAGTIGQDEYGKKIEEELKSVKTNLKYLSKQEVATPLSHIIASKKNNSRTIVTYKEKDLELVTKNKIDKDFDAIILDGYEKTFADSVLYENKDAISILDAGRINKDVIDLAYKVDYVITSKFFAEKYTNIEIRTKKDLKNIYDNLYDKFNTNIVITLEEKGCFTKIDNKYMIIPTIKVKTADTTAAGDIFHAAFAYFITHNYSFLDSLRLSNISASLSTEYIGSRYSIPKLEKVLDIYEKLYK